MKAEEACIYRFGLYELLNYIFAKRSLPILEEEYEELEQSLYDDIPYVRTSPNYDLGIIGQGGFNLENYVLDMIEQKDLYLKKIERFRKQEELLDMALDNLTPRERDVINIRYFNKNNDLGLSPEFFREVLSEAQEKLCSFIEKEKALERQANEEEHKLQRKQLKRDIQSGRLAI